MPEGSRAAAIPATSRAGETSSGARHDPGRILLEAIKNSTTRMDQIVLRRIGLNDHPPRKLK